MSERNHPYEVRSDISSSELANVIKKLYKDVTTQVMSGQSPAYISLASSGRKFDMVEDGVSVFIDQNRSNSVTPKTRSLTSMAPEASILLKKKAFSTLKGNNDLQYMDKTERMLLRATKALFAIKVQQIRAYESLTKFNNFYEKNNEFSLNLLAELMSEAKWLTLGSQETGQQVQAHIVYAHHDENGEFERNENYKLWYSKEKGKENNIVVRSTSNDGNPTPFSQLWYEEKGQYVTPQQADLIDYKKPVMTDELISLTSDDEWGMLTDDNFGFEDMSSGGFFSDLAAVVDYATTGETYSGPLTDVLDLLKRQAFSRSDNLTTWIVDPDSVDNYLTGPGTGVIEITMFTSFNTDVDYTSNSSAASITLENPYRLTTILDDDIECAIEEALNGTIGLMADLSNGTRGMPDSGMSAQSIPPIDGSSVISAALEMSGLGDMDSSLNVDYIRDRLRTFYLGKPIINPADSVHFYIRGNKAVQNFSDIEGFSNGINYDPSRPLGTQGVAPDYELDDVILRAERMLYTKKQLPFESSKDNSTIGYKDIRKLSDNSFGMVHIFAGYVTSVTESYSGGQHKMNVSCVDNMGWLNWSRFVIEPSLSDVKGVLEDPLTPYEMMIDNSGRLITSAGYELLDENKYLLQNGMLSFDSGILSGRNATESNIYQGQYSGHGSLYGSKIIQHPHGFIYRWKSGILTATADFNTIDPISRTASAGSTTTQQYSLTAMENVLTNLDVANVISTLIVGQPYNMETFLQQALEAHNISGTGGFVLNTLDPLSGVIDTVTRQNRYYGNFKPYRSITMNSASLQQMSSSLGLREAGNSKVKSLQDRQILIHLRMTDLKLKFSDSSQGAENNVLVQTLQRELDLIRDLIKEEVRLIKSAGGPNEQQGVGVEINLFGESPSLPQMSDAERLQDVTRAMMLVGAQRRIEDVRLNRDNNFFIVSDQYDQNTDIKPFLLKMHQGNWKIFDSGYTTVAEKCQAAASYLNLEFFCNSQGHLELRPPLWNRVPLTVLQQTIKLKNDTGRNIIPNFITDMFKTRIEGLRVEVHKLNVRIVIISLMMGRYPDRTIIPGLSVSGKAALLFFGIDAETTGFGSTGSLTGELGLGSTGSDKSVFGNLRSEGGTSIGNGLNIIATFTEDGDLIDGDTETMLGDFDAIFQEDYGVLNDLLTVQGGSATAPAVKIATVSNLNNLRNSFINEFGQDPASGLGIGRNGFEDRNLLYKSSGGFSSELSSLGLLDATTGVNGLFSKLNQTISERDSLVAMLNRNRDKQGELEEIESMFAGTYGDTEDIMRQEGENQWVNDLTNTLADFGEGLQKVERGVSAAIDILKGDIDKGSIYDHLIEDDTRNLLGYGSGKRFIINDDQIVSVSYTESPPDFTRVDVQGDAPLGLTSGLQSTTDGTYHWAGATDFDLWRQYGYKYASINLPFASDAEAQCRPYAMLQLQVQKTKINRASITVAGNEFYQPGDTVYIPSKGLLYYVEKVGHSFSYGSSFDTTLSLTYGHPPGSYLPTPLDVIGQKMTKDILEHGIATYRNIGEDDNYRPLQPECSILFPSKSFSNLESLLSHGDNNLRFTNMMVDLSNLMVGGRYLLLRGFVKDQADYEQNIGLIQYNLQLVRSLFENPLQIQQTSTGDVDLNDFFDLSSIGGLAPEAVPMTLPNNVQATPIASTQIIEQISYLNKEDTSNPAGDIRCMDKSLLGAYNVVGESLTERFGGSVTSEIIGIFPKGGPRQNTWLNIRDDLTKLSNIIEVGIITIPNGIS
jgi:hypothetical protein|tara:strand:- start:4613 stop:9880 length:5268 start_codon:yes stop_codon:yes gene_type:complete